MLSVDKETLAVLRRLGLNQYESKTYLALASTEANSATELSDIANIPRPRVYDVLAKLEKKGFVMIRPGRPARYAVVPISNAIASLKKEREEEHRKGLEELEKLEEKLLATLDVLHMEKPSEEDVYVIKDRRNIYATIGDLIERAQREIILSSHKEGLQRKREEFGELLHKARKRGVNVRLIENTKRFIIIDDHAILFLSDMQDPRNDKAAWIQSPYIANALKEKL